MKLINKPFYLIGVDPYIDVVPKTEKVETVPFPEMVEALLQYYPGASPVTLQQIFNRYENRLSKEEALKLKSLIMENYIEINLDGGTVFNLPKQLEESFWEVFNVAQTDGDFTLFEEKFEQYRKLL